MYWHSKVSKYPKKESRFSLLSLSASDKKILLTYADAMARGCGAKKSAQKGKCKSKGPSSSTVRKTKSVDEVTGVSELNIPSSIRELNDLEEVVEDVTIEDSLQLWRNKYNNLCRKRCSHNGLKSLIVLRRKPLLREGCRGLRELRKKCHNLALRPLQ